ncbi:uncharacterized protein BDZ99DRAFT_468708 [Mytilinidion resinicola]|uniref:CENP-V/GFA domain-containing protein n=1 Tax=Mytilinidion resinicola TaxID=574789 RepID=A0A6A6Y273_9PEZI|nr:uncharacterized protein BDZ99DRAFT_468708 [Mytilinidion resinicola]KAF2802739.1 hypothetical protein BDZ99DRAFT_468708 [Mytilinidion resinicola]
MTTLETILKAHCLCNASHVSVAVPTASLPLAVHLCHCNTCRRTHGSLCVFHAYIPAPTVDLSTLTAYASSKAVKRYFCTTCGTHMLDYDCKTNKWNISISIVEGTENLWDFSKHIYLEDTKDGGLSTWLGAVGGKSLQKWAGAAMPDSTSESGDWKAPAPATADAAQPKEDILHASCHCGGVSLNIARPTPASRALLPPSLTPADPTKWYASNDVCTTCRFSSGSAIVSWIYPAVDRITLADGSPYRPVFGTLKQYRSSPDVSRTFCGVCGAKVAYHVDDRPDMVDVAVGVLDAADGVRAESWLEWRVQNLSFEEDVIHHALVNGLKEGLKTWAEEKKV